MSERGRRRELMRAQGGLESTVLPPAPLRRPFRPRARPVTALAQRDAELRRLHAATAVAATVSRKRRRREGKSCAATGRE